MSHRYTNFTGHRFKMVQLPFILFILVIGRATLSIATIDNVLGLTKSDELRTRALHAEDDTYWDRMLEEIESMSVPTASPPTSSPSQFPSLTRQTESPSFGATSPPVIVPSMSPSFLSSAPPIHVPSTSPSAAPSTAAPSNSLSSNPSSASSTPPSDSLTRTPSAAPSTAVPSTAPSLGPSTFSSSQPSDTSTNMPSATASQRVPSSLPSFVPSCYPTTQPSASQTNMPSLSQSANPSRALSNEPTSTPTTSPTRAPSISPTSGPTVIPTKNPSNSPTIFLSENPTTNPSSAPTSSSTDNPAGTPSRAPSRLPSQLPSFLPSASPSDIPFCQLDLAIECVDENGTQCEDVVPEPAVCTEPPVELVMEYFGGTCDQNVTTQPPSLFLCFDFSGGPPIEGEAYIEATDARGFNLTYFAGNVGIGERFSLDNGGEPLLSDTSIIVYASEGGTPRQVVTFHTGCAQNLFLKDRYGANQVVEWTNEGQGTVNCVKDVTYKYATENLGGTGTDLFTLVSTINGNPLNLTDRLGDAGTLGPGEAFTVNLTTQIDFTNRQAYVVTGNVTGGEDEFGSVCSDSEQIQFEAGSSLPSNIRSSSTWAPSASPAPSIDPKDKACVLEATVECMLTNGVPCSVLSTVPQEHRACTDASMELTWLYSGRNCNETASHTVSCMDMSGGPANTEGDVYVDIRESEGARRYFGGKVSSGDTVVVRNVDDSPLMGSITVVVSRDNDMGEVLQMSTFSITCGQSEDLTLGRNIGALELVGYRNLDTLVQGFEHVRWVYSVSNIGGIDATILAIQAIQEGEDLELLPLLLPGEGEDILRAGHQTSVVVDGILDLVSPGMLTSRVTALAEATGGLRCDDDDETQFSLL